MSEALPMAAGHITILPDRVRRLQRYLADREIDVCLVSGDINVTHQSGYYCLWRGLGMVVVPAEGEPVLLVPVVEVPGARETAFIRTIIGYGEREFGLDLDQEATMMTALPTAVPPMLHGRSSRRVGLAGASPRVVEALSSPGPLPEIVDCAPLLAAIRQIKDPDEREALARSYRCCLLAQDAVGHAAREGVTEIELFALAQRTAILAAGTVIPFGADILGGSNSADISGPARFAGTRPLVAGDVLIADIGAAIGGYSGDTARTHSAGPMPDPQRRQLARLDEIKLQVAERLRPGTRCCDLYAWARRTIEEAFPAGEFPHHLGHAVGLAGLEDPHLVPMDTRELREGMVLAIEPGIYFPGRYGLRTEDMFEVTAHGGRRLSAV